MRRGKTSASLTQAYRTKTTTRLISRKPCQECEEIRFFLVAKVEDFEGKKCFQQIIDASCFKNQIVKLNLSGKEFIISLKNLDKFPKYYFVSLNVKIQRTKRKLKAEYVSQVAP